MTILNDKALIKRQYIEGVNVFSAGDEAKEAFIIEKGEVRVFKNIDGKEKEVAVFKDGDIFGEMALIRGDKHSSTAAATKRTNLIIITQAALKKKIKESDPLIAGLVHLLARRLHESNLDRFGIVEAAAEAQSEDETHSE